MGRKRNEFSVEQRQQHHHHQQLQQDEHEQLLEQEHELEQEHGQENYFPCDEDSYCNSIESRTDNENKNDNVSSESSSASPSPSRKLLFLLDTTLDTAIIEAFDTFLGIYREADYLCQC